MKKYLPLLTLWLGFILGILAVPVIKQGSSYYNSYQRIKSAQSFNQAFAAYESNSFQSLRQKAFDKLNITAKTVEDWKHVYMLAPAENQSWALLNMAFAATISADASESDWSYIVENANASDLRSAIRHLYLSSMVTPGHLARTQYVYRNDVTFSTQLLNTLRGYKQPTDLIDWDFSGTEEAELIALDKMAEKATTVAELVPLTKFRKATVRNKFVKLIFSKITGTGDCKLIYKSRWLEAELKQELDRICLTDQKGRDKKELQKLSANAKIRQYVDYPNGKIRRKKFAGTPSKPLSERTNLHDIRVSKEEIMTIK